MLGSDAVEARPAQPVEIMARTPAAWTAPKRVRDMASGSLTGTEPKLGDRRSQQEGNAEAKTQRAVADPMYTGGGPAWRKFSSVAGGL